MKMLLRSETVFVVIFVLLMRVTTGYYIRVPDNLDPEKCAEQYDIEKLIPLNDILNDVLIAYKYDPEVRAAFQHLISAEFKEKTMKLESRPEYQAFKEYILSSNFRILEAVIFMKTLLPTLAIQADNTAFPDDHKEDITGGVHGLIMRIFEKRLSLDELRNSFKARMICDPKYKEKIDRLHTPEFKNLLAEVRSTPEYKELIHDMEEHKIYLDVYLTALLDYFNIEH